MTDLHGDTSRADTMPITDLDLTNGGTVDTSASDGATRSSSARSMPASLDNPGLSEVKTDSLQPALQANAEIAARPDSPNQSTGRGHRGRFAAGNTIGGETQFKPENWNAMKSALRSDRWPPELEILRDEVETLTAAMMVDEGDVDDVPARRKALLGYRARLHRRIIQLDALLELRGLVDKRGRLRAAWLQQFAAFIEKARALDVTLGLNRRQKRVPTLSEYLEQRGQTNDMEAGR